MAQGELYTGDVTNGLVAFGANLPTGGNPPEISIPLAMERLAQAVCGNAHKSPLYHTPAFPVGAGPQFVNAAMRVDWTGTAAELLELLHQIEEEFGRTRSNRWAARVMDLDLIGLDDAILPDPTTRAKWASLTLEEAAKVMPDQLILPHPRLAERAFVLVPLADIAPQWVDPATGLSVAQMLTALPPEATADIHLVPDAQEARESGCK